MTLTQLVLNWNNQWRYDLWYRHKHNIRFNSKAHRKISQIDIAFEYIENKIEEREKKEWEKDISNEKWLKEHQGEWLRPRDNKELEDELFKNLDITDL